MSMYKTKQTRPGQLKMCIAIVYPRLVPDPWGRHSKFYGHMLQTESVKEESKEMEGA
jgi:hypothetical protein